MFNNQNKFSPFLLLLLFGALEEKKSSPNIVTSRDLVDFTAWY